MAGKLFGDVTVNNTSSEKLDNDDLSSAQIHQLLVDAERRLKSTSGATEKSSLLMQDNRYGDLAPWKTFETHTFMRTTWFWLTLRLLPQSDHKVFSYIQSNPPKAHIDQTLLVTHRERNLANRIRHIEDPVIIKYKIVKVLISTNLWNTLIYSWRNVIPKSLDTEP